MLIAAVVSYQFFIIILHFVIYDRVISENSFTDFGTIIDHFVEAIPLVVIWTMPIAAITQYIFHSYPIIGITIALYPYYKILKWLNDRYFFVH